jgi:hypothetical protein
MALVANLYKAICDLVVVKLVVQMLIEFVALIDTMYDSMCAIILISVLGGTQWVFRGDFFQKGYL